MERDLFPADIFNPFKIINKAVQTIPVTVYRMAADLPDHLQLMAKIPVAVSQNCAVAFLLITHLRDTVVQPAGKLFVIRIKIRHEPEVIQRMLDTVMPHIPHQVWEHGIYVSAFPCPAVYGSPGKVMAEIIDAGHFQTTQEMPSSI